MLYDHVPFLFCSECIVFGGQKSFSVSSALPPTPPVKDHCDSLFLMFFLHSVITFREVSSSYVSKCERKKDIKGWKDFRSRKCRKFSIIKKVFDTTENKVE